MTKPIDIAPEDCPEPYWHQTHRYCPACSYAEAPCSVRLADFQGELAEVACSLPPGHEGQHQTVVRWL